MVCSLFPPSASLSQFLAAIIIMPLHSILSERDIINFHPSRVYLKEKRSLRLPTSFEQHISCIIKAIASAFTCTLRRDGQGVIVESFSQGRHAK